MLKKSLLMGLGLSVAVLSSNSASAWYWHKKPNLTGLYQFNSQQIDTSCQSAGVGSDGVQGQGAATCNTGFNFVFDQNGGTSVSQTPYADPYGQNASGHATPTYTPPVPSTNNSHSGYNSFFSGW